MFSTNIRSLRNQMNLTQREVAAAAGTTVRTIQNYEKGTAFPKKRQTIRRLANLFNVPVSALLDEDDYTYTPPAENDLADSCKEDRESAYRITSEMGELFAGGRLEAADRDTIMRLLMEMYWDSCSLAPHSAVPEDE